MMRKDFPSCFGESGVQVADCSSSSSSSNTATTRPSQNLVSCIFRTRTSPRNAPPVLITATWIKTSIGRQGLTISIDDDASSNRSLCRFHVRPWLFFRRKGNKHLRVNSKLSIRFYWDLSSAKFGFGPEPLEGFYVAVVLNEELILMLGDLGKDAVAKIESIHVVAPEAVLVARIESVYGSKSHSAKAQLFGEGTATQDLVIECQTIGTVDPWLVIRIDGRSVMEVKRLRWKFRGNGTVLVEGMPVEVYWDVHGWLFGNAMGRAVFLFQSYVYHDRDEKEFGPCDSVSGSPKLEDCHPNRRHGFSLTLYAWKNE